MRRFKQNKKIKKKGEKKSKKLIIRKIEVRIDKNEKKEDKIV